eukprot:Gb_21112 [translate_table: standard]
MVDGWPKTKINKGVQGPNPVCGVRGRALGMSAPPPSGCGHAYYSQLARRASKAASGEGVSGEAVGALSSVPSTLFRHGTLSPVHAKGDREGVDGRGDGGGRRQRSPAWKGALADGRHRGGLARGKLFATGRTSLYYKSLKPCTFPSENR